MKPLHLVAMLLGLDSTGHPYGNHEECSLTMFQQREGGDRPELACLSMHVVIVTEGTWNSVWQLSMKRRMNPKLCQVLVDTQ